MTKNLTLHTPTPWAVQENGFKTQFIYGSDATQKKSPMGVAYNELVAGGDHPSTLNAANAAFIVKACNSHDALVKALTDMVAMYVDLVDSGDAGFWDAEKVDEVIASRAALALAATPAQSSKGK